MTIRLFVSIWLFYFKFTTSVDIVVTFLQIFKLGFLSTKLISDFNKF